MACNAYGVFDPNSNQFDSYVVPVPPDAPGKVLLFTHKFRLLESKYPWLLKQEHKNVWEGMYYCTHDECNERHHRRIKQVMGAAIHPLPPTSVIMLLPPNFVNK